MEELALLSPKTGLDIAQALQKGQLCEGHAEKLVVTGEILDLVVAPVALDAPAEGVQGKMFENLSKDNLACVHGAAPALR